MEATITASEIGSAKGSRRLVMVTAADEPSARLADSAGVDIVLVGDSLAMAALGRPDTLTITVDEMIHHTRAAAAGARRALLVADMPFGSYQTSIAAAVGNACRLVAEGGARAVKLEGPRFDEICGDRRRGDSGRGPHRLDAAVAAPPRRVPRSGPRHRSGVVAGGAGDGLSNAPGRSFWYWRPSLRRWVRRSRGPSPFPPSGSAPVPTATVRSWSSQMSWGFPNSLCRDSSVATRIWRERSEPPWRNSPRT